MRDFELFSKCDEFEKKVVDLREYFTKQKRSVDIANRLAESSVGVTTYTRLAYMERSDEGFVSRMRVALERVIECECFIRMLYVSKKVEVEQLAFLLSECSEIKHIIQAALKTLTQGELLVQ